MSTLGQFVGAGVKSIQRGVISLSAATSNTATISSVNTAKTELRYLGVRTSSTSGGLSPSLTLTLTNSTTITADAGTSVTSSVSWELTEFY